MQGQTTRSRQSLSAYDYENQKSVNKGLYIIFILLILIVNFWLLSKFKSYILQSPRRWLIMTLSLGDILRALFSLIVSAMVLFKKSYDNDMPSYRSQVLSPIYSQYVLPFVYSIGIITLCCEVAARKKNICPFKSCILLAAIPWISGLILPFPLQYAGFDEYLGYRDGFSETRWRISIIISIVLPSVFALCFAIYTKRKVFESCDEVIGTSREIQALQPNQQTPQQSNYPGQSHHSNFTGQQPQQPYFSGQPMQQNYPGQQQPPSFSGQPMYPYNPGQPQPYYGPTPSAPPLVTQPMSVPPPTYNDLFQNATPQTAVEGSHQQSFPEPSPQPPMYNQQGYSHQPAQLHVYNQQGFIPQPGGIEPSFPALDQETVAKNVQNERSTLVMIAVANFLLTVPNAMFMLFYDQASEGLEPFLYAAISGLFYWMSILRSVITPFMLIKNDKRS